MLYLKCLLVVNISLIVRAFLVEDLQLLFDKEPCVEASLVSISSTPEAAVMIDKNSQTPSSTLINITEITKKDYEKSVASKINELAQYNEIQYSYELLSEEGPSHNKKFEVLLKLGDEKYTGFGPSLKEAKNSAAQLALSDTLYEHPPVKLKPEEKSLTPTVVLNNVAMKLGIGVSYYLVTGEEEHAITSYGSYDESYGKSKSFYPKINSSHSVRIPTEESQITGPFTVRVKVGDSVYIGNGHTIQAARHDAAINAIKSMEKQVLYKNNVCANEESVEECKKKKEELKSPITRVHEAGQKRNLPVEFNIISESGKSHKKVFITQCKLGDFVTEGEGNSKKSSKKRAAEKMLENFPLLSEVVDGNEIVNGLKTKKKRKKKSIIKNNVQNLGQSISNMLTQFWTDDKHSSGTNNNKNMDKKPSKTDSTSPKDKMLELSNILNIQVQFTDLNEHNNQFYTLMSLGVKPLHVCLGKASTRDESHNVAALHGLKFLQKEGALGKAGLSKEQEKSYYFEDYLEGYYNVYTSVEEDTTDV